MTLHKKTAWQKYGRGNDIVVSVDTSKCGFKHTPAYVTGLAGNTHHWATTGSSEIYAASPTKFNIYINKAHGVAKANKYGWHVVWMASAVPSGDVQKSEDGTCTGRTPHKATAWKKYGKS